MQQHTFSTLAKRVATGVSRFLADENGATAVEYALLASLIGVAIIGATTQLGGRINTIFQTVTSKLSTSTG